MTTFELPSPPDAGIVWDRFGSQWTRRASNGYWYSDKTGPTGFSWALLLDEYGPAYNEPAPCGYVFRLVDPVGNELAAYECTGPREHPGNHMLPDDLWSRDARYGVLPGDTTLRNVTTMPEQQPGELMTFPCGASMRVVLPAGFDAGRGTDRLFSTWQEWHGSRCNCHANT